jgi:hypothetical protein
MAINLASSGFWDGVKFLAGRSLRRMRGLQKDFPKGKRKQHEAQSYFTKRVLNCKGEVDLLVSAADLSYVKPLLRDILVPPAQFQPGQPPPCLPRIKRLVIRHLSDDCIDALTKINALSTNFKGDLKNNIQGIRELARTTEALHAIEVWPWDKLPKFHGVLCGDLMLIGPWIIHDNGELSSMESESVFDRKADSKFFADCEKYILDGIPEPTSPQQKQDVRRTG